MGNNQHSSSLTCQVLIDPTKGKTHGTEGDASMMSYARLSGKKIIITCPTCTKQLDEGAQASGSTCCHAPVATVRALSKFRAKLIAKLEVVKGHCSFRACNRKLTADDDLALQSGDTHRRICNECGAALDLIATRAKEELAAHEAKTQPLSKSDLAEVREQIKLMPTKLEDALRAIQKRKDQRVASVKNLFLAQLETAEPTSEPEAEKKDERKRLPKNFGSRCRVMVRNTGSEKTKDKALGIVAFTEACHRAHESNTVLAEEIAKTARGRFELAQSDEGMAVLVRLGKRQAPAASASEPEAPVPVAPSAPAASAEAQA